MVFTLLLACSSYDPVIDAFNALGSDEAVTITDQGRYLLLEPVGPKQPTGIVFYPGGLVEHASYAPPLRLLAEQGFVVALVSMPSDLAVYAPNRADRVLEEVEADQWVIAGHSLGGAMAASYAEDPPANLVGLALWAAYPAGSKDLSAGSVDVLSITATEDGVLDRETWEERRALLPADATYVSIEGGNHAGFGDYGAQKGDGQATISPEAQHQQTAEAMAAWIGALQD